MTEDHTTLDLEYDRMLLEDVFDSPNLRYVSLYMYIIRKDLFQDLLDDDVIEQFETITSLDEPTVEDITRICTGDFIKALFQYKMITNLRSYEIFQSKGNDFKIRFAKGLNLTHDELSESEEEVHIFFNEAYLERILNPIIPEMTQTRIHESLERLRAMMCPKSSMIHELVHKYGDFYVIDDDFYYIIEEFGNPYQALRIELMIRAMSSKYKEIESNINEVLKQYDSSIVKAPIMKKLKQAKEKGKEDYVKYLIDKSRKKTLPHKFWVEFPDIEIPDNYVKWKDSLNQLFNLKLKFIDIDLKMDELRAHYSGKNQKMTYLKFIQKSTYDEDNISERIKTLLIEARNSLKEVSENLEKYPKKEMKLLNLDIERMIIEKGLDEEED
ncbi:hypothetical protein DSAG12_00345 [Promethearchaeum syntrophicum]|uniref:Uncharacterized protein n=1 Tax=Promethearchaeum syntrophicum TaxID=2594042 RepID=A0A5B9D671_9ARCH|nr:hypothetical protein [Candidatus Prometheoarchaeum syntrophicum]QEE14532.1 hypothetical protein DSAG12_00345 [Candidatus Prometheoarchaeum syntrophicum]